jgi:hypothetical protein
VRKDVLRDVKKQNVNKRKSKTESKAQKVRGGDKRIDAAARKK